MRHLVHRLHGVLKVMAHVGYFGIVTLQFAQQH